MIKQLRKILSEFVPDYFKSHELCNKAVWKTLFLVCIADCFVTQGQVKLWHDGDEYCKDNKLIKWCEGYQKCRAQKAKIKKELMPISWHP